MLLVECEPDTVDSAGGSGMELGYVERSVIDHSKVTDAGLFTGAEQRFLDGLLTVKAGAAFGRAFFLVDVASLNILYPRSLQHRLNLLHSVSAEIEVQDDAAISQSHIDQFDFPGLRAGANDSVRHV